MVAESMIGDDGLNRSGVYRINRANRFRSVIFTAFAGVWLCQPVLAQAQDGSFTEWLGGLKREAQARGISPATLETAFRGVQPIKRVIELDRRQPEFTQTFWNYLNKRVSENRIRRGRQLLQTHRALFERVGAKYGVQPRFLVAFWGLESNFGDYTGVFPVVGALATLAYDPRRSDFFRAQLLSLLSVIERGDIPVDVKGSWAGAMGNCQFIPSTYQAYAVDFDGDGKRDMWNSLPDVFGSAANYLSKVGWDGKRTWGREVRLPKDFDWALTGLGTRKSLADWQGLGVRRIDGRDLPQTDLQASLVLPSGFQGPAFLVYKNFRKIMIWNRSILYAIAVGHLADRLAGQGQLRSSKPEKEVPLSRADIKSLQVMLRRVGFEPGGVDGVVGPMTRKAIKDYQSKIMLPPDGYPTMGLLERLRGVKP